MILTWDSFHVHNLRTRIEYQTFCNDHPHRPCEVQYISSRKFCRKNLTIKRSRPGTLQDDLIVTLWREEVPWSA